jgi:hypothetical protein
MVYLETLEQSGLHRQYFLADSHQLYEVDESGCHQIMPSSLLVFQVFHFYLSLKTHYFVLGTASMATVEVGTAIFKEVLNSCTCLNF